jgi:hypothetical protein
MVISDTENIARAGVAFAIPVHPGSWPSLTAHWCRRSNGHCPPYLYRGNRRRHSITLYNNLNAALTAQILTAVNASFLGA